MLVVQDLFISANIDFTDYIRTTEERHVAVVEPFWVRRLAVLHDQKNSTSLQTIACFHTNMHAHTLYMHILMYMIDCLIVYNHFYFRSNYMMKVTFTRESMKDGILYQTKLSWQAQRLLTMQNWVQRSAWRRAILWSGALRRTIYFG